MFRTLVFSLIFVWLKHLKQQGSPEVINQQDYTAGIPECTPQENGVEEPQETTHTMTHHRSWAPVGYRLLPGWPPQHPYLGKLLTGQVWSWRLQPSVSVEERTWQVSPHHRATHICVILWETQGRTRHHLTSARHLTEFCRCLFQPRWAQAD